MRSDRWEHGSDFDLATERGVLEAPWSGRPHTLWGSGRDAMRALLAWGRAEEGWARLFVPGFYCQEVVTALAHELPVIAYRDASGATGVARPSAHRAGDVVLVVNTYGAHLRSHVATTAVVIEDHTHDPLSAWAFTSDADWALASLRKTLPLPDGGVIWSPIGRALPAERAITNVRARASADRLSAMILKAGYLTGLDVAKDAFLALALASEQSMGAGEISGISAFSRARLPTLPGRAWRDARARNLATFRLALGDITGLRLLDVPFAATLVFDVPEQRDLVRRLLIAARIYPAVLWSLQSPGIAGIDARDVDLSTRVLCLHCDSRYDHGDMSRVAEAVRRAVTRTTMRGLTPPAGGGIPGRQSQPA